MKKLIVIICILLIIFISLLIYRKSEQNRNITAQEVDNIQNYISEIYMWKEVTGEALPIFDNINNAPEKWFWEAIKKNIDNYDNIVYDDIQKKVIEIFGDKCTKVFPKEGNDVFIYNQEAQNYELSITQLDSDNDTFIINKIDKTKEGYVVEIIEYIEDYSEEEFDPDTGEEKEYNIYLKNLEGERILSVKNTEGQTKILEQVKANEDKFSKKTIKLTSLEDKIFVTEIINS